jgi:uncharacterized membrane protein
MRTLVKIRHYCDDRIEEDTVEIMFFGDDTYNDVKDQVHCHFCDSDVAMFIPTDGSTPYPIHQYPDEPIMNHINIDSVE